MFGGKVCELVCVCLGSQANVVRLFQVLTSVTTRPALLRMKATSYEIIRLRSSSRARCTTCQVARFVFQ